MKGMTSIVKNITSLIAGFVAIYGVYVVTTGHLTPGGGFAGALVAATAFALFAIAEGPDKVRRAVRLHPATLAVAGLALAAAAGLPALFSGAPFLTGVWWELGPHLAVGTPLIFDIGVFLAVLGAILSVLLALEEN